MAMSVEQSVEFLARETEVLGEDVPQCGFVHHKSHMTAGSNSGRRGGEAATNRLSHSTASQQLPSCNSSFPEIKANSFPLLNTPINSQLGCVFVNGID
jgi:hypothetical protein